MQRSDRLSSSWQLHFRCVFDLELVTPGQDPWSTLVRTVRGWIRDKEESPELIGAINRRWFFEGDRRSWAIGQRRVSVETRRFAGSGSQETPELWALRYEHSADDPATFMTWRTDMAVLAPGSGPLRLALQVSNALHPGFVGPEPTPPTPSAPKLISKLLTSAHWRATAGSAVLRAVPEILSVGQGQQLIARLADPDRRCPLLLLSSDRIAGNPKLNASRLARLLAGTAQVVVAPAGELAEELAYLLPYPLRCTGGTVRLYLPGVRMEMADADFRRHRFVRVDDIEKATPAVVEDRFVSAVARRLPVGFADVAWGTEDVLRREREARVAAVRGQLAASADREVLELFEADNIALQKDNRDLTSLLQQRDDELDAVTSQLSRMTFQRDHERTRADVSEGQLRTLRAGLEALECIPAFPTDVAEVIDWVTALWGDRIVFTERARKSATKASINRDRSELPVVWQVLRSMAIHLHPLLAREQSEGGTLPDQYKQRSGFELTLTEGKQTKKDNKLMQLRQLQHEGQVFDITPHVKYGNKSPKCLRVHFAVQRPSGVIVVGHCGDHLDTYGTQRLG